MRGNITGIFPTQESRRIDIASAIRTAEEKQSLELK